MGIHDYRPCPCKSGKMSWWELDGRGIPLCRVCEVCREKQMAKYNSVILSHYTQADIDEQIEPDE